MFLGCGTDLICQLIIARSVVIHLDVQAVVTAVCVGPHGKPSGPKAQGIAYHGIGHTNDIRESRSYKPREGSLFGNNATANDTDTRCAGLPKFEVG